MQAMSMVGGVCGACGCDGRALAPAGPLAERLYRLVLADALGDVSASPLWVQVESVESRLCWECDGRLATFVRFARRAAQAQRALLLQAQGGGGFRPWPPRLQSYRAAVLYCGPAERPVSPPKFEQQSEDPQLDVKPEPVDVDEEPVDRVDALALPVPPPAQPTRKKRRKKEKDPAKRKNNKRAKKKPKEKSVERNEGESSDGLSDLGSLLDLYTDEKTGSEERHRTKAEDVDEGGEQTRECGVEPVVARPPRRAARPPRAPPACEGGNEAKPPSEPAAGTGAGTRPRCVECDKEFSSRKTYRYHLSVIHEGRNRYPCATCGKVYQWKSNLWRHMKNHAARAAGDLYCAPCRRAFASVATYTQHLRASRRHVREDQFRYACADCGRRFPTKTRLRDHVDWDHLQAVRHRCDACHKPFKSKMSLYVHVKNVHRRADAGLNLCHVCGKSYQNQAKLKYHIVAMHTTETPYACARCGAAFGWYSSLYRHQREVHDKIKLQPKRTRPKKGERVTSPPALAHPPPPPPPLTH